MKILTKILTKIFAGIEAFVSQDKINFSGLITKMPSSLKVCQNTLFLNTQRLGPG
jgi:hypothetical protein